MTSRVREHPRVCRVQTQQRHKDRIQSLASLSALAFAIRDRRDRIFAEVAMTSSKLAERRFVASDFLRVFSVLGRETRGAQKDKETSTSECNACSSWTTWRQTTLLDVTESSHGGCDTVHPAKATPASLASVSRRWLRLFRECNRRTRQEIY